MIRNIAITFAFLAASAVHAQHQPIYVSSFFELYPDAVKQGPFEARALSPTEIASNYRSLGNDFMSPRIDFKFSINGRDNEMLSGRDHRFNCLTDDGECETPLITFGQQMNDERPVPDGEYLAPETKWKIRLDMRKVFHDFTSKGFYETFNGSKVYSHDFKGVYVAGGTRPLTWDFDNLQNFQNLQLHDPDGDHIYELTLSLNAKENERFAAPRWKLSLDTKLFPQHSSSYPIVDALYNLSIEEMIRAVEEDSTLRTGKEWAGVWTRDVSYSTLLSMAILQTKAAQYSLMKKVKDGVIVQDTGTGGAYPVSTDRMIWAIAAWEIYKVTGDKEWLSTVYPVVKKSIEADQEVAFDEEAGLMKGESSFLDWREQTYPDWMQPADIYESMCLGTNAVHYQANVVLASMATALGETEVAQKHESIASVIRSAINEHLWLDDKKYFSQYLYGRNFRVLSPRSEALGEALCVLFDVADPDRQKDIIANVPVNGFGIPCIFPQIPGIPPYHNNGIWPFVQSYWTMASAKAGNEDAVLQSIAAIWRPEALFLTNKENFVANTGDFAATQINSDNMLWSLSGNIGVIYKVLFGIHYNENSLTFKPFVPEALKGKRTLTNFPYRGAVLDIEVEGFGSRIRSVTMDGHPLKNATLSSSLQGRHIIKIVLANNRQVGQVNMQEHSVSPSTPVVSLNDSRLSWTKVRDASLYRIIKDGHPWQEQTDTTIQVSSDTFAEYQVIAIDKNGLQSFASEPQIKVSPDRVTIAESETFSDFPEDRYKGFTGNGYVRTNLSKNSIINFQIDTEAGTYVIDFRYANGNGPVNTDNKCAIRTLKVDGKPVATIVFPQRGTDEWSDWGFSNNITVQLARGTHDVSLEYTSHNANMNGLVNEAVIDSMRLIHIK